MLDARVWWPLFPLLLLVVSVSLTWALVAVVRRGERGCLLFVLIHHWKQSHRSLLWLNAVAWVGILADTSLHYLVVRR